jgi:hypothetical protein
MPEKRINGGPLDWPRAPAVAALAATQAGMDTKQVVELWREWLAG